MGRIENIGSGRTLEPIAQLTRPEYAQHKLVASRRIAARIGYHAIQGTVTTIAWQLTYAGMISDWVQARLLGQALYRAPDGRQSP